MVYTCALLWFPALFLIAWNGLEINPLRGTLQRFFPCGMDKVLFGCGLPPLPLGAAYYLIPAILGRTIDKYYLAIFGFWCIAALAPWSVVHHLEGGPVPMWIPAIGTVMSIAMVFPNCSCIHELSCDRIYGYWKGLEIAYPLRFVIFGTLSYTVSSYIGVVFSLPAVAKITQFTIINEFHFQPTGVWIFQYDYFWSSLFRIFPESLERKFPRRQNLFTFGLRL